MLRAAACPGSLFAGFRLVLVTLSFVLSLGLLAAPAAAQGAAAPDAAAPDADSAPERDSILQDIIDMLEADLSEDLVREWLSAFGVTPGLPTADDMVALRAAGASDELMRFLLEVGRSTDEAAPAPSEAAPAPAPQEPSSSSSSSTARPTTSPTAPAPATPSPTPTSSPTAPATPTPTPTRTESADASSTAVRFRFRYSPMVLDDEKEWDFYVYLDGRPLAYVPEKGLLSGDDMEFALQLAPGRHVLRVALERHVERRGGWSHEARVAEEAFPFEIEPGEAATVELVFNQSLLRFHDPLSFRLQQGQRIDVREDVGGRPDRWPELCEEIETEVDGTPSRSERRRLEDCTRWASLWTSLPDGGSTREEARRALARFDYRPVPKSESLF